VANLKHKILVSFTILIGLTAVACGATLPTITPTLEIIPLLTGTPTPGNTPLPAVTPTRAPTSTPTASGNIDVGGYKLVYRCYGQGTPTVIIEAGGGDRPIASLTWSAVTQEVQNTTRICLYNRVAGVRTSQDIAEDLHFLLSQIPVPGPYILVGHSIGGYHVRVYAHLYPEDVAGVILVDTTAPDSVMAFATAYPTYSPDESPGVTNYRVSDVNAFPTPDIDGLDFNASDEQVRQAGSLGDIPLIVISASIDPDQWTIPGFSSEDTDRITATMLKLQSDLATLSSQGVFMVANTSKHFISLHEPQIIIDAITQMVREIQED
jgi:pimeloyl-ACP methyl ester carboxylesterase